jgi:hypothetical protein
MTLRKGYKLLDISFINDSWQCSYLTPAGQVDIVMDVSYYKVVQKLLNEVGKHDNLERSKAGILG